MGETQGLSKAGVVAMTIVGLIVVAVVLWVKAPAGTLGKPKKIDMSQAQKLMQDAGKPAEAPKGATTQSDWQYVDAAPLPAPTGGGRGYDEG